MERIVKDLASISQLMIFSKIVETQSLTKAASKLGITPSAVSKSLAQLEERVGTMLVRRTTRSVALTEHGKSFFEGTAKLLNDIGDVVEGARKLHAKPAGQLTISCSIAFGVTRLAPLVTRYCELYPEVVPMISLEDRHVKLAEDTADIALRITALTDWPYPARKLAPIHWIYCASPQYLQRFGTPGDPGELADHRCLVYRAMTMNGAWSFRKTNEIRDVQVKGAILSNSSSLIFEAAKHGQGIACLPTYLVADSVLSGQLQPVLPEYRSGMSHTLYAMYFHGRHSNPCIRTFIDFLADEIGPEPSWDADLENLRTGSA